MDCIFCKIIAGEIPNYTVYEDEHTLAFFDIHPIAKGHTVVIPKTHGATLAEVDQEQYEHLLVGVRETMKRLEDKLQPDAFNVGWNHGEVAGQSVFHLHLHVFPRYDGDGGGGMHGVVNNPGDTSVEDLAKLFV